MKTPLRQLIDNLESYQEENKTDVISIDLLKRVILEKFVPVEIVSNCNHPSNMRLKRTISDLCMGCGKTALKQTVKND